MTDPKTYLLGIAGFMFILVAGGFILASTYGYGNSVNQQDYRTFNKTFNRLNEFQSDVSTIEGSVKSNNATGLAGDLGLVNGFISQSWNSLKLLLTSFTFVGEIVVGLSTFFGIPAFVGAIISTVMVIIVVFGIIYLIFQVAK